MAQIVKTTLYLFDGDQRNAIDYEIYEYTDDAVITGALRSQLAHDLANTHNVRQGEGVVEVSIYVNNQQTFSEFVECPI